jgi:murein DD-endopeptidase MepM/ murein hydrolase activator NlpD
MFHRPARGLFDFILAALCVWAAYYHTPAGALVRRAGAWAFNTESTAKPLLAYFGGGDTDSSLLGGRTDWSGVIPRGDLTPELALGYGAYASLSRLSTADRAASKEIARRYDVDPAALDGAATGPDSTAKILAHLKTDLGTSDAAVVALLCGYEAARYARDRAIAEGGAPGIEQLARQLPPDFEKRARLAAQALTLSTAYGLSWPVGNGYRVSSPFGVRDHPVLGMRRMHTGVDLAVPVGASVRAAADGMVRRASEDAVNGRVLVLDHGHGVTTAYCHNSELLVRVGQSVARSDVIAHSGNTGRSTGPHLHYQLELADSPVDPLAFRGEKITGVATVLAPVRPEPMSPKPAVAAPPAPEPEGAVVPASVQPEPIPEAAPPGPM